MLHGPGADGAAAHRNSSGEAEMRVAMKLAAVLGVIAVCGCGTGDAPEGDREAGDTAGAIIPSASGPAGATSMPADNGEIRNVSASLTEWAVALSQDSVPAGAIAFEVRNAGTMPHRFEVEGGGEEWATEDIAPGGDITMSVTLEPGEYEVYCPIEGGGRSHAEQGMRTRLRVY